MYFDNTYSKKLDKKRGAKAPLIYLLCDYILKRV